ncbi:MAG: amidase [Mangrovicoccus sp.]
MAAEILSLDALTLRNRIASGALSAAEVAEAYLAQIAAREPEIRAWAWHDPGFVRAQAAAMDKMRQAGRPLGALHGLPVGLKDIIDTAQILTENGSVADRGRVPLADSFVVERLKAEGAVIMGKTVTTELAYLQPGPTRNPHHLGHTPGGSSSGPAAAVASAMVPLAIGTQTAGSVIRPASFCGVTGFKPSFGAIPRRGVLQQSQSLDTLGVFARNAADAALLAEALYGYDPSDAASSPRPHPRLSAMVAKGAPLPPRFAVVRLPGSDRAEPQMLDAIDELTEALGDQAFAMDLPAPFEAASAQRQIINMAEMARNYYIYGRDHFDALGPKTQEAMQEGAGILARDYLAARDWREVLYAGLGQIFEHADAILCPASLGPAPQGLDSTGDSIFNGLWTFTGCPAVSLPLLTAENGLPMGVQLVGPRESDGRLLRTAAWLQDWAQSLSEGDA